MLCPIWFDLPLPGYLFNLLYLPVLNSFHRGCTIEDLFMAKLQVALTGHISHVPPPQKTPQKMTHSAVWTANAASKQPAQYEETGRTWKTDALTARCPRNPGVSITLALSSCNGNGEEGAACYQNKSASADSWGGGSELRLGCIFFLIPHFPFFPYTKNAPLLDLLPDKWL